MRGKVLAIGYCVGGGYVLEQARAAARFQRRSSCSTSPPQSGGCRHAVQYQGPRARDPRPADPVTPKPMMDALEEELTKAKIDWQVMMFGRRRAFVLRSDRQGAGDAVRRKALPQILYADARLFRRDAVMARTATPLAIFAAATAAAIVAAAAQTLT